MNTILVSYDLIEPGKNYPKLKDHLEEYEDWAKPLLSVWLIKTDHTAAEVRDEAKKHVDKNDKIIAIDITDQYWATTNIPVEITDWMKSNL